MDVGQSTRFLSVNPGKTGVQCEGRLPQRHPGPQAGEWSIQWGEKLEAATGFEPVDEGFAGPCLTTWLRRLRMAIMVYAGLAVNRCRPCRNS